MKTNGYFKTTFLTAKGAKDLRKGRKEILSIQPLRTLC
jgi:hypothetical protein